MTSVTTASTVLTQAASAVKRSLRDGSATIVQTSNASDVLAEYSFVPRIDYTTSATSSSSSDEGLQGTSDGFLSDRFGLFLFCVVGTTSIVLFLLCVLREYSLRKYGGGGGSCGRRGPATEQDAQIQRDQEMAEELQRQLNEEGREEERIAKRKERREWYEYFMKPYTMVR